MFGDLIKVYVLKFNFFTLKDVQNVIENPESYDGHSETVKELWEEYFTVFYTYQAQPKLW